MNNYRLGPLRNTNENRERIIAKTRKNMQSMPPTRKSRSWKPVLASAIALLLCLFLAAPYIQQAFLERVDYTIEKVIIPDAPYDALINATYIEDTNEFIYRTDKGYFVYDVEGKFTKQLVNSSVEHLAYDYAASADWLVWSQATAEKFKIHVLNRQTGELDIIESAYFYSLQLIDDTVVYLGVEDDMINYFTLDLLTGKKKALHEYMGEGSSSMPAIDGTRIAIVETAKIDGKVQTVVTVYDAIKHERIGEAVFPYEIAQNLLVKDSVIYSYLWNEDTLGLVGQIDLEVGLFQPLETPKDLTGYATNGEQFALAVKKGDSDTVQIFTREGNELVCSSKLSSIKERIVKPRFTEQGTLVVNGEGKDRAVYLIRFD